MKATELMVGDWVLCPDNMQRQVRYLQVRPSVIGIGGSSYDEDEIQPIPLTPEILEKTGFVKYRNYSTYHILTKDYNCIELRNIGGNMAVWIDWEENNDGIYYDYLLPFPKYVHELQHALRLCGIDKEIEI